MEASLISWLKRKIERKTAKWLTSASAWYTDLAADCYTIISLFRTGPSLREEGKFSWQSQPHMLDLFVVESSLPHDESDQHTSFPL